MPITPVKYRIKDYNALSIATDLLDKIIEVETATGTDKNYKVPFPLLVQGINNALPAPQKTTHVIARTYDSTDSNYIAGDETFLTIVANRPLVHMMTARVEFPHPTKEYRLVYDPSGTYRAYRDSTFTGGLNPCSWVEIGSAEDIASGVNYFNPFETKYLRGNAVKYSLNGSLRIFEAKQDLVKSTFSNNQQPAPTGLLSDPYWTEINSELAPNFSRLGQLECRFYYNSERDIYGGDTVEDLIAREVAGAGILYTKRQVTVELGPNAGVYEVAYNQTSPTFYAYVDGTMSGGKNPCAFVKVNTAAGNIILNNITENVGGFRVGDSFNGTYQDFATRLTITYQNPAFTSFSFNLLSPGNVLAGISYNPGNYGFTWSTSNSTNVLANTVTIRDVNNSANLALGTANDGTETVSVAGFTIDQGQNKHFQITAKNTQNVDFAADFYLFGVLARMYGASSLTPKQMKQVLLTTSAFVAGAYGLDEDLSTSLANNITADCTGGKYVYYLYDASWADPNVVRAGLNAFSAYMVERIDFNDSLGNPRKYKILYTTTIQYGAAVNVNVVN